MPNGEYCKTAYIGHAVMDADVFISLNHFKGHEATGFGGAIKNIGMGCGSRAGKMEQHNGGHPHVDPELCRSCRRCAKECGSNAISYDSGKAWIDPELCKGCGRCIGACAFDAISNHNDNANEILGCKMAEYAAAVCNGPACFHITLVTDVPPTATATARTTRPSCPTSACSPRSIRSRWTRPAWTLCQKASRSATASWAIILADPHWHHHHDHFRDNNPNTRWKETLEHAEKIGLGSREYELVVMK